MKGAELGDVEDQVLAGVASIIRRSSVHPDRQLRAGLVLGEIRELLKLFFLRFECPPHADVGRAAQRVRRHAVHAIDMARFGCVIVAVPDFGVDEIGVCSHG